MLDAICEDENASAVRRVSQHGSYSISEAFRLLVGKNTWYSIWFKPILVSISTCKLFQYISHISILFSELFCGKNSTGNASSSPSATISRHQNNGAPIVQNMYKPM